jgi:hypothetical protein
MKKKIRLNRETLRNLQTGNLEHVAGGNTPLCTRVINCSNNPTCPATVCVTCSSPC